MVMMTRLESIPCPHAMRSKARDAKIELATDSGYPMLLGAWCHAAKVLTATVGILDRTSIIGHRSVSLAPSNVYMLKVALRLPPFPSRTSSLPFKTELFLNKSLMSAAPLAKKMKSTKVRKSVGGSWIGPGSLRIGDWDALGHISLRW